MKRILLSLLFVIYYLSFSVAQNADKDINSIKRDTSYIYSEVTMKDAAEAQAGARAILEVKVGDWVRNKYPHETVDYCLTRARENWLTINTRRGNYHRVLVYVKKSDVIPIMDESEVIILQVDTVDTFTPVLTSEEERMISVLTFEGIEPYVKGLKRNGQLLGYGKYATLPQSSPCHIFVYGRDGRIMATLRQTEDGQYTNLLTLKEDNIKNYKNCGAIWFQLKQQEQ